MRTNRRHLISIRDLSDGDLRHLVARGGWFASGAGEGHRPLRDSVVATYFRVTSTRTRAAFSTAALRLGAGLISFGPADLQENTGEAVPDTARVLSGMLDGFVARTAGDPGELRVLADQPRMAVVNAMSADEHPTQAIADLTTLVGQFGDIDGLRLLYLGEGNNTAAALALAFTRFVGTEMCLCTPPGYGLDPAVLGRAERQAARHRGTVFECREPSAAMADADVVYTTRWQTTGTTKPRPDWRDAFLPYRVQAAVMARHPKAVFMHDLPAHRGEEVSAEVLDGADSIAFTQANAKLHSAMAVLEWCLTGGVE